MRVLLILSLLALSGCAVKTVNHGMLCLGVCYDFLHERKAVIVDEVTDAKNQTKCEAEYDERAD